MLRLIWVEVSKRRAAILGWGIGLAAYAALILAIAPELADQFSALDLGSLAIYQAMGVTGQIDSVVSLLSLYLPFMGLMAGIYAMIAGVNALAGEEEKGTLENVLAMPLPRWKVVVAKAVAISLALALVLLLTFAGFALVYLAVESQLDSDVTLVDLLVASAEAWPICFAFAMSGMLLGAYLPRRSIALLVGFVLLAAAYFINNLAGITEALEPVQTFSVFNYYSGGSVLTDGVVVEDVLLLVAVGFVALLLTLIAFQRRDVTVGQWPWQRRRVSQS